ncbi:MAG: zinc ABC transporter substrate-binding protein, partial [Actinobacteria bacterium]|nr:zinc ABC transporter substrate-binding protein [Actinomycetota bacterium]
MTRETVSKILLALLIGGLLLATGCGTEKEAAGTSGKAALDVVASGSFLADVAQNVAGDRFEVHSLVPLETDPHSFEPTPKDLGEVTAADLVIINGGGLEGPLLKTLENAG